MIAYLSGVVTHVEPGEAVVEVGGVGLSVQCTPATLAGLRVGRAARVATSLVVREDSLTLYGFADDDERVVFDLLQTASGVGPKLAQAVLAVHGPDDLRRAVHAEDLAALTKVSGVGKKGAQRIVLELKDRLGPPRTGATEGDVVALPADAVDEPWRDQVRDALVGLGWAPRDAEHAVSLVAAQREEQAGEAESDAPGSDAPGEPDVPTLLRAALRTLARP